MSVVAAASVGHRHNLLALFVNGGGKIFGSGLRDCGCDATRLGCGVWHWCFRSRLKSKSEYSVVSEVTRAFDEPI